MNSYFSSKDFINKNILLLFAFLSLQEISMAAESGKQTLEQKTAQGASNVGSWAGSQCASAAKKIGRNKATYTFFGAHAVGAVALAPVSTESKVVGLIIHYLLLGRHFKNSYYQGLRFDDETESFQQLKILNTSNWLEKNGVVVDGVTYTRGFQLWQGYQNASNKKHFLRNFLSVIMVDSTVIVVALEALTQRLADCSNPSNERYTNTGLLIGKCFYSRVYPGKSLPHNIATWLWQEERGGDLFKTPLGEACFEEWLNEGFLTSLRVYETDSLARMFSLTEDQNSIAGFRIPWYRISSWSRNAAARYYVALLKQYVFLLSCRALCDEIMASHIVDQKQDLY